jgi:hypothetical protein
VLDTERSAANIRGIMARNRAKIPNRSTDRNSVKSRRSGMVRPSFQTLRVSGPLVPPDTTNDIIVTKQVQITINTATSPSITPVGLNLVLPALPPVDITTRFRFVKASVWGTDTGTIRVTLPETTGNTVLSDNATFLARGTPGQQRAQVHLAPGWLDSSIWRLSNDERELLTVETVSAETVIINFTLEIRQIAPILP